MLRAVSVLLENPRGRTHKKLSEHVARYSGDESRARAAKPRVAWTPPTQSFLGDHVRGLVVP